MPGDRINVPGETGQSASNDLGSGHRHPIKLERDFGDDNFEKRSILTDAAPRPVPPAPTVVR